MYLLSVFLVAATLLPYSFCFLGIGRRQSVAARGRLQCNGVPASNVKVKLYEKELLFDKKLDEGKTDSSGSFYLSGSKTEITNIDPKVNIYHKCEYIGPCYKKISITIPDSFITRGSYPQSTFDIGTINLAGKFKGQSIDCIN
ncbi:Transthyretin-like family protein [Necator americanus]|uniref:Transthyretin-like family protein n=1 Tax=Necator americanus TaxID=51031 RepID=W2T1Z2_NECAM|nr:Transthyretin-like family protein [Necator americanus]ETN75913.1 Transthyretin-like family protein [Necator americanus]